MSVKDDFDDDLANVFFNTEEFAEVVVYRPANGSAYNVNGIFEEATDNQNPQGNGYATVQNSYIRIKVREADIIGGVFKEDKVTARGRDFLIYDKDSSGVGLLTLHLQEER